MKVRNRGPRYRTGITVQDERGYSYTIMKATKSMGKEKADAVEASGLSDYVYSTFRGSE